MTRDRVLEQIRKLRVLANDVMGTPEGAAAARKARELMERHGITRAELFKKRPPEAPRAQDPPGPANRKSTPATHIDQEPPTTTPVTVTVHIGNFRIRWKP